MPIGYTVDAEKATVFIRAWGVLTEADISAVSEAMRIDEGIMPDWGTLTDLREVESVAVGGAFARGYHSAFSHSARRAVITASNEGSGLVRMVSLTRELAQLGVFDDPKDALAYLGLPPATELPDHPATTFGATLHA